MPPPVDCTPSPVLRNRGGRNETLFNDIVSPMVYV
jgi:hypothetical protein